MLLNCGVGENSWESLGLQGDPTSQSQRKSVLNIHWKDWCWRWNSNTLATWYEELTPYKRPWCWERLKAGGEGEYRIWDGWMASSAWWTWVWASSRSWWRTGKPGCKESDNWATEFYWQRLLSLNPVYLFYLLPYSPPFSKLSLYSLYLNLFSVCLVWMLCLLDSP